MLDKDLVDLGYEYAVDFFKKSQKENLALDFNKICKGVKKLGKFSDEEFDQILGSFYADLLQDNRFVFLGNDQWTLKDLIPIEQYRKNQNSLYNYDSNAPFQEVYDEDALPSEMTSADNEVYEENENEISRDSFDDETNEMKYEFDDEDNINEEVDNDKE